MLTFDSTVFIAQEIHQDVQIYCQTHSFCCFESHAPFALQFIVYLGKRTSGWVDITI